MSIKTRINRTIASRWLWCLIFFAVQIAFFTVLVDSAFAQASEPTKIENPLGGTRGLEVSGITALVAGVIQKVLGIVGSITLLVFVYGGFLWLTSAGKQEQVAKGTKTMLYAIIGIAVIFSSYIILDTVIKGLTQG